MNDYERIGRALAELVSSLDTAHEIVIYKKSSGRLTLITRNVIGVVIQAIWDAKETPAALASALERMLEKAQNV